MNVANARSCLNAGTRGTMGIGLGQAIAVAEPPAALPEPVLGRAYGPTRGPTKATSVALLWPISSGAMSSWMTFMSLA